MKSKIIILAYHSVSDSDYLYAVNPKEFERQLVYLNNYFKIIGVNDLEDVIKNDNNRPGNYAIVTFDDGLKDNFSIAFPVLRKLNIPATVFVATGLVGKQIATAGGNLDVLSWQEIQAMRSSGLIEFGCHTHGHLDLSVSSPENIRQDLLESKKILEQELGMTVKYFAYPKSRLNELAKQIVKDNFNLAFGGDGIIDSNKFDKYEIPRIVIRNKLPIWKFKLMCHKIFWRLKKLLKR